MALRELPTSFNIDGVDWNDPDPFDVRIITALQLAYRERLAYNGLQNERDFSRSVDPIQSIFSPAVSNNLYRSFWYAGLNEFYIPDTLSGSMDFITEDWIAKNFPLVICPPSRGESAEVYSEFLRQQYQFINLCHYVYYDRFPFNFLFDEQLNGYGDEGGTPYSTSEVAYNAVVRNFDYAVSEEEYRGIERYLRINIGYGSELGLDGYFAFVHSSGCAGNCYLNNASYFNVNLMFRAEKMYDLFSACGLPYAEGEMFTLSAPRGEKLCEEFSGKELILPSYTDIQSMITSEDNDFYTGFKATGVAVDLSPSFQFFSET